MGAPLIVTVMVPVTVQLMVTEVPAEAVPAPVIVAVPAATTAEPEPQTLML